MATTRLQQLQLLQPYRGPFWLGNENSTQVCEFALQDAFNFHFPHTMQQLYRCWSLWRDASNPVLVFPRRTLPENIFIRGYVAVLEKALGLRVVSRRPSNSTTSVVVPLVPPNTLNKDDFFRMPRPPYYAWSKPDDARMLRDEVLTAMNLSTVEPCRPQPNITILNRRGTRELANVDEIARVLGATTIAYFDDNTSFRDQVDFFRTSELILSPHGAQLTGIPFQPDCAGILELFPVGYYLPHFFGSLASASGLTHGFVLLTKSGDWVSEIQSGMENTKTRNQVRSKSLCPRPADIQDAVNRMVRQREACCDRLSRVPNKP